MSTTKSRSRRLLATLTVAALLWACGGSGGGSPTEPPTDTGTTHTVEVIDNAFSPQSIQIQPGDTVRWVMQGGDPTHTVTDNDGAFDSGFVFEEVGDTFSRTFGADENGRTFEYFCQSHRQCCQMQGSVRVGDDAPDPSPGY